MLCKIDECKIVEAPYARVFFTENEAVCGEGTKKCLAFYLLKTSVLNRRPLLVAAFRPK